MRSSSFPRVALAGLLCLLLPFLFTGCSDGVTVTEPDPSTDSPAATPTIAIALSATSLNLDQGGNGSVTVTVTRGGGFTGAVGLYLEGAPAGVTGTFNPASVPGASTSSTLRLDAAAGAPAGQHALTVRARGEALADATRAMTLHVEEAITTGGEWAFFDGASSDLPHNWVTTIAIDDAGVKWVGTRNGLATIDGESWTVYTTSNSDLPGPYIFQVAPYGAGRAWVDTGVILEAACCIGNGVVRFDGATWTHFAWANSSLRSDDSRGQLLPAADRLRRAQRDHVNMSPPDTVPVRRISLSPADSSWRDDPAARESRHHFFVGRDLWSAETGETAAGISGAVGSGGGVAWLVSGMPGHLLFDVDRWGGFARRLPRLVTPDGRRPPPVGESCDARGVCRDGPYRPELRYPGPYLNADLRQTVYFRDGDLWRAEIDWATGQITGHRQLTQVGVLNEARRGDIAPIAWHGHSVLFRSSLSRQHPILRIDTRTGDIEQLASGLVFESSPSVSPTGSRVCAAQTELLACYDLRTGETFRIALPHPISPHDLQYLASDRRRAPALWANDDILLVAVRERRQIPTAGHIVRIDFRDRQADMLFTGRMDDYVSGVEIELLPGGRHVAAWISAGQHRDGLGTVKAVRVAIEDGGSRRLPDAFAGPGRWVNDQRYLYTLAEGRPDEIGTWVYDLAAESRTRICQVPAFLSGATPIVTFPDLGSIYFGSQARGGGVFRADLAAGQCQRITEAQVPVFPVRAPPIDLHAEVSQHASDGRGASWR